MTKQPFSLANLRDTVEALYRPHQWQLALARDLNVQPRTIKGWFNGKPLPDLREKLADLCRRRNADPHMQRLARKFEKLGPPSRPGTAAGLPPHPPMTDAAWSHRGDRNG